MAENYGIKVSKVNKEVTKTLNTYEYQILSTKEALKGKSQGVSAVNVAHGVTDGLPVVLKFKIEGANICAASGAIVDTTNFNPNTQNSFYRIFYNKQAEA